MKQETAQEICGLWELLDETDDFSLETQLEIVRSNLNLSDNSVVVDGLIKGGIL